MQIDINEYFMIVRGVELRNGRTDRSYNEAVFLAMEICGPLIIAKCVKPSSHRFPNMHEVITFNTNEVEMWPLSKLAVKALGV